MSLNRPHDSIQSTSRSSFSDLSAPSGSSASLPSSTPRSTNGWTPSLRTVSISLSFATIMTPLNASFSCSALGPYAARLHLPQPVLDALRELLPHPDLRPPPIHLRTLSLLHRRAGPRSHPRRPSAAATPTTRALRVILDLQRRGARLLT